MNATIVYQVVKALPKGEQKLLFDKLKNEFEIRLDFNKPNKIKLMNKEVAINYLLKNVFGKRKHK